MGLLALLLALPNVVLAGTGYVECELFHRQPDENGYYRNVQEWKELRCGNLSEEITDGLELGLEGDYSCKQGAVEVYGNVRESRFENLGIHDPQLGVSATAMPHEDFGMVNLVTGHGKDLYEAWCWVKRDED